MHLSFAYELGDDSIELIEGKALVWWGLVIDGGAVHHLEKGVIIKIFVELLRNGFELIEINYAILVLVINGEDFL